MSVLGMCYMSCQYHILEFCVTSVFGLDYLKFQALSGELITMLSHHVAYGNRYPLSAYQPGARVPAGPSAMTSYINIILNLQCRSISSL